MTFISNSGIVLFLTSIQSLSISIAVVSYYRNNNIVKNYLYNWVVLGIILSLISLLIATLSYYNIIVNGLYHMWTMLFVYLNLIITVIGIHILKSPNGFTAFIWIIGFLACIVFITLEGYFLLPLSPSIEYKEYTG